MSLYNASDLPIIIGHSEITSFFYFPIPFTIASKKSHKKRKGDRFIFPLFSVFPAHEIPPVFRFSFRFRLQIGGCRSTVLVGSIYGSAPTLPLQWFLLPMSHSYLP